MRLIIALFLAGVATTSAAASSLDANAAAQDQTDTRRSYIVQLQTALSRAQEGDCNSSLGILKSALDDPLFAKLPEIARAGVFELVAACAVQSQDKSLAYSYALAGTGIRGAGVGVWQTRLELEDDQRNYAAAVDTVETMAKEAPDILNTIEIGDLVRLERELKVRQDTVLRRRLLVVLTSDSYHPREPLATGDDFKKSYATFLVDDGKPDAAGALVSRIQEPGVLMSVSVDRRLSSFLPADFDGRAATERWLAKARDVATNHPESMYAVLEISRLLRDLGRTDEALATLRSAEPDGHRGAGFSDLDEQRNWWWDELSKLYARLGRYDDAVTAIRRGADAKERGGLNVSQTINLASLQVRFSHDGDALATVAAFETGEYSISAYGQMALRTVRGCARARLGQAAAAKEDLSYAVAHERESRAAVIALFLCVGDADGAAAAMVRMLDDPDDRAAALLQLSEYDKPPAAYPLMPFTAQFPRLRERPDVRAAISKAGGTRCFHLQY